ncbi:MAG: ABC transporter ATP-binding protein [Nitrososphaerota archaeon]
MPLIELKNVMKYYDDKKVLDNVSLTIEDKSITCILAPPNSGKTTLLKIIAGLEKPDSGTIEFDRKDVTRLLPVERKVAMVFQSFALYPHMSCFDNIASPLRITGKSQSEIQQKVREVSKLLKIEHVLNRRPAELSGGEKQRVSIARALVRDDVEIYLLDEPLTNVDYKIREEMRAELRRIFKEKGGTIILASPDPLDAFAIAQNVVVMYMGKILQTGRTREIYNRPANTLVGQIFSRPQMNLIEATLKRSNDKIYLNLGDVNIDATKIKQLLTEDRYLIGIRAEKIFFVGKEIPEDTISLVANVIITEVEGSESVVHLDWDGKRLVMHCPFIKRVEPGERVQIAFKLGDLFIFKSSDGCLLTKYGEYK